MAVVTGSERARRALGYLRGRIVSGEWPINSRIPTETELMQLIGVGKTTVREAVRSLATLGLLETLPGRGTFVRSRTPVSSTMSAFLSGYSPADLLSYRRALEVEAARRAATSADEQILTRLRSAAAAQPQHGSPARTKGQATRRSGGAPGQFHALVVEASASRLLIEQYANTIAALRRMMQQNLVREILDDDERARAHGAILDAIEASDPLAAAQAMMAHTQFDLTADG